MATHKHFRGFTLIELLVVITIIGIISGMTVTIAGVMVRRARVNAAEANIQKFETALENYYHDMQRYPPTPEEGKGSMTVYKLLTGDQNVDQKYDPADGDTPRNHPRWREPYLSGIKAREVDSIGNLLDPWGRPYRYFENEIEAPQCPVNPNSFLIYSLGPDGKATDATREEAIDYALPFNKDNIKNWRSE